MLIKLLLTLYFLVNSTKDCLVLDRSNNRAVVSVAATGFGCYAWVKAYEYKLITREKAILWINTAFDTTLKHNVDNRGWLYHFTDTNGNPVYDKQVSTIDTAIFYSCVELAANRLNDKNLIQKIYNAKSKIDISLMTNQSGYISHGFVWVNDQIQKLPYEWDNFSEGIILYKWLNIPYKPKRIEYNLPLFVYYYPLCFDNDPEIINHLGKAIDYQIKNTGTFGLTACDDPIAGKYSIMKLDVISPLSVLTCTPFFPALCKINYNPLIPSITRDGKFINRNRILIDDGAALIILSEYK